MAEERTHKGSEYQKANIGEFAQAFKKERLRRQLKKRFHGLRTNIKTSKRAKNLSVKYKKSLPYGKLAEVDYLFYILEQQNRNVICRTDNFLNAKRTDNPFLFVYYDIESSL